MLVLLTRKPYTRNPKSCAVLASRDPGKFHELASDSQSCERLWVLGLGFRFKVKGLGFRI